MACTTQTGNAGILHPSSSKVPGFGQQNLAQKLLQKSNTFVLLLALQNQQVSAH
jgi:hypothetical protein